MQKGFIWLALRNEELLKSNDQLKQQLDEVLKELNVIQQERKEKAASKEARANRKRLPKRDPITREIYKELIKAAEGPTYTHVRTRIALCILAVTGIRINELLPLKVNQLQTLIEENWIAIDRSKRRLSNHKALGRVAITKNVNKVMHKVSNQLPGKLNITSHSFRIGYITQLWKDSKDIEFVKQTIGHRNLDTTSAYIKELSEQERQERIFQLQMPSERSVLYPWRVSGVWLGYRPKLGYLTGLLILLKNKKLKLISWS